MFALLLHATFLSGESSEVKTSLPQRSGHAVFFPADRDTLFELPHKWINVDSLRVKKNGFTLEPYRDYRITDPGHFVWVYTPLVSGDTLNVEYFYTPIPLLRSYLRRSLRELTYYESRGDSAYRIVAIEQESVGSSWSSLRRSGSLVRSIQIGSNRDLTFESALSLQVEGKVGNNVDVIAALSDQNLPLQPEGTTESIRELDKVFVTARSPHLEATIGDYELELAGRRYDRYTRKLSGLKLKQFSSKTEAAFSAAVSKGEFHSNSFFGVESVQGPYQLTGKSGETGIVVLAGTEQVWIDGLEVRRGENNDYTIDYASGQVTFTARRLITSDSRILVEFEYANEDYERQFLATRAALKSSKLNGGVYITYISESDDRERPLGLAFDDADIEQLRFAGDSLVYASSSSADSIGPNGGDYVRSDTLVSDTSYSIFKYIAPSLEGEPQGEWRVFFDDFGAGNGDYEAAGDSLGRTYFRWIGVNAGRYLPSRRLPLPTRAELAVVRLEQSGGSGIRATVEGAFSVADRNTYSSADDADNDGSAGSVELGYDREEILIGSYRLRNFSVSSSGRMRGRTFQDVSRSDVIEFDREWAVSTVRQANETIGEAALGFSPLKHLSLSGSGGVLSREDVMDSRRYSISGTLQPTRISRVRGTHTSISSDDSANALSSDWTRQQLDASTEVLTFKPRVRMNRERQFRTSRSLKSGFRFVDWAIGSAVPLFSSVSLDGEVGRRTDDSQNQSNEFVRASQSNVYTGDLRWQPLDLGRGVLRWIHRDKNFESGDSANVSSDAGRFELLLTPRNRAFEVNFVYDALKSRTEQQIQVFSPVQAGTGNYRLENGVYIPDDQGDFILVSRNTGEFEPSSEIRTNAVVWLKPDELKSSNPKLWQRFALETEAIVEERTRLPLTLGLLMLDPAKLRVEETIDGRFSFRQDVHFNRLSRAASFRLRLLNSASQVSRFSNGAQETIRRFGSLRARLRYHSQVRGETEVSTEIEQSRYDGVFIASRDVVRDRFSQDVLWTLSEKWEAGVSLAGSEASDENSRTQASVREVAPRIGYSRYNKGRVDAEFRWVHASSNRGIIPQEVGGGANRGENFRWSLRGTLAMSDTFSGSLNYTGRLDAGENTVHIGRVEVRATF